MQIMPWLNSFAGLVRLSGFTSFGIMVLSTR